MNLTPNGVSRQLPRRIVVESEPIEANSACCYGEGRPVDGLSTNRRLMLSIRAANFLGAQAKNKKLLGCRKPCAFGCHRKEARALAGSMRHPTHERNQRMLVPFGSAERTADFSSHPIPGQANETGGVPCLHRRALPPSASMQASTLRQDLATACLPALAHFCDTERLGAVRQGSSRLGRARLGMARKGTSRHGRAWIRFCGNDW